LQTSFLDHPTGHPVFLACLLQEAENSGYKDAAHYRQHLRIIVAGGGEGAG